MVGWGEVERRERRGEEKGERGGPCFVLPHLTYCIIAGVLDVVCVKFVNTIINAYYKSTCQFLCIFFLIYIIPFLPLYTSSLNTTFIFCSTPLEV